MKKLKIYSPIQGSSPLARGLPDGGWTVTQSTGIIPARAGFTYCTIRTKNGCLDHPRSRGVYEITDMVIESAEGSSPLARGLLVERCVDPTASRIIPARAGFTRPQWCLSYVRWDHPRSRGVYKPIAPGTCRPSGSSPLARGLRSSSTLFDKFARIIPARAGFTWPRTGRSRPARDHPRSRGVYIIFTIRDGKVIGSSPLARGLPSGTR